MSTTPAPEPTKLNRNFNPSPKASFRTSVNNISEHRAVIESRGFERGVMFARAEYVTQLAKQVKDGNSAMAVGFRLLGMEEFLTTLNTLSEETILRAPVTTDNLPSNLS